MLKRLKYLLYRLQWTLAPCLRYGKIVHIDLEINNNCNQSCISCWHSKPKELPFKIETMNLDMVMLYIRHYKILGAKSIKFNLRGEPLLNKNLINYIRHAERLGFIDIMINTNGILLSKEKMIELDQAGLTSCTISVDSLISDNYCKLHGCNKKDYSE